MAGEMERALGYLTQAQEDQRAAEELLTRAYAGRAMAMRLVQASIEAGRAPARRGGVAERARKFDSGTGALGARGAR